MSDWIKWLLLGLLSIAFGIFVLGADVGIDNIDDAIARQAVQLVMLIREKAGKQVPLPMRLASRELNVSHVRHAVPTATSANGLAAALVR